MRPWTCILKQPCDASWVKHVKGHLTSIPSRRTRWEIRSISMKPRPVLDWSITKLHLPLMRVSFDRCPRALISDSFSWPMFPCSRVLRVLLRVLLYRDILWKRGKKKAEKKWHEKLKLFKWEKIFVTDRCAKINDLAVSYKKRKRNGSSFHLATSKF